MKQLLFIATFSLFSGLWRAQTIDRVPLEKKIDTLFKRFNSTTPGAAVTVLHKGNVITRKQYGMAHLEHSIPFTHRSPVRLGYSMGREFMTVGLAQMEAEGLLRFDDKVRGYFPKLPEWSKDVTVRDLLNHASGFDDEWSLLLLMTADMRSQVEKEQVLTLLYNQPKPQVEPGTGYMYNNTDMALLRLIMEIAAKQPLPDYLKKRLFEPLGMTATLMNDDVEAIIPGLAENYYGAPPFRKARFLKLSPGGNYRMVTSAEDLEKWARAADDPTSVVAKAYSKLYKNGRPMPMFSPEKHYPFGHEMRTLNGTEVIYHGGVGDSYYMVRIPSRQISVIGLGNGYNFIRPTMQLAESLLPAAPESRKPQRFFPAAPVKVNKEEMLAYTGRYYDQQVGYNSHIPSIRFFDLKLEGDQLKFYPDSAGEPIPIAPFGNGYFKDIEEDAKIQFSKPSSASPMKMEVWLGDKETVHHYVRKEDNVKADRIYLEQFTGQFHSPHLDYYLRIVMNGEGQLIIKRPTVPDTFLEPDSRDRFLVEQKNGSYSVYMIATFTRNKKGAIDGFSLRDSRMMHHRFDKVK